MDIITKKVCCGLIRDIYSYLCELEEGKIDLELGLDLICRNCEYLEFYITEEENA